MYNRGVCIHHCSLSYCKRRNHIFFYDPSQFHQYGYQLFYKRHNNTAAYFMFFPAREKLSFKISSKQYMLYAFFQYLLCTEHRFSTPYAACSFNGVCNGRLWLLFVLAIILHNKNDSFPIAVTMRYINVIVVLLGFASYG